MFRRLDAVAYVHVSGEWEQEKGGGVRGGGGSLSPLSECIGVREVQAAIFC